MDESKARPVASSLSLVIFAVWLLAATLAASILTSWHWVSIPILSTSLAPEALGGWRIRHYLSSECACSLSVAGHLVARGPIEGVRERVFFADSAEGARTSDLIRRLTSRGFAVERLAGEGQANVFAGRGIHGVPALEVISPEGAVAYRGGYRDRGSAPDAFRDAAIVRELTNFRPAPAIPVFGCAVTERFRRQLDPFGLKRF